MKKGTGSRNPRFFRITRRGKIFIVLTVAIGAASINTGNNLLYLCLAMNLSIMITSGILSDLATRDVYLNIFPSKEIFAGEEGTLYITVINRKRFIPIYFLNVIIPYGEAFSSGTVWYVTTEGESSTSTSISFSSRGLKKLEKVVVMTRFPFGLFEKYYHVKGNIKLIIFPKPLKTGYKNFARGPFPGEAVNSTESRSTGHSIKNIRDYVPTDPVKMVLWKKYMTTGNLYVKEMEGYKELPELIVISPEEEDDLFENQISSHAARLLELKKSGIPFTLRFTDFDLDSSNYQEPYRLGLGLLALMTKDGRGGPWLWDTKTVMQH